MSSTDCAKQTQRIEGSQHTQQEMDETQLDRGQRFVQADTFLFFFLYIESIELFWPGSLHFFFSVGRFFDYEPTHTQWRKVMERKGKKKKDRRIEHGYPSKCERCGM